MAELRQATERLQAALDKIERAVGRDGSAQGSDDLRAALETARHENAGLQEAARTVADRLDDTIARLKRDLRN